MPVAVTWNGRWPELPPHPEPLASEDWRQHGERPAVVSAPLPWDELADAFGALEGAERGSDTDAAEAALKRFAEARDRMGLVAATILHAAFGGFWDVAETELRPSYVLKATRERFAEVMGWGYVMAGWKDAEQRYQRAVRYARRAHEDIDALAQRVRELEAVVANLLPGVGEPVALRVVG